MTSDPDPPRLRAADPDDPTRTDTRPAGTVLAIVTSTLALAALLNADVMLARAETSELGPGRDVALAFWRPVENVASTLRLTSPRDGLEALQDLDPTGSPSTRLIATNSSDQEADPSLELAAATASMGSPATSRPSIGHVPAGSESTTDPSAGETDPAGPETAAPQTTSPEGPTLPPNGDANPSHGSPNPDARTKPNGEDNSVLLRRPTAEDPLRLLIIGDSTLDPVGTALLRDLGETGVADGVVDYRVSTGLSRPDFFDWPAHLREVRPQLQPEVVVIMIGANDAQAFVVDNRVVEFGSEEWLGVYRSRVAGLLDELTNEEEWVIWIGQPAMRNDEFDAKMHQLNKLYAEEISRYPTARFVDSRALSVDDNGDYAAYLLDGNGDRIQVRQSDGVHLTPSGGDRLAPSVIAILDFIAPL